MVQAAVADIVSPAVAAHDPDALADQGIGDGCSRRARGSLMPARRCLSRATRSRWAAMPASVVWSALEQAVDQVFAHLPGKSGQQLAGELILLVQGQAHAQAEFGIIFEQGVGPGRAAAVCG